MLSKPKQKSFADFFICCIKKNVDSNNDEFNKINFFDKNKSFNTSSLNYNNGIYVNVLKK